MLDKRIQYIPIDQLCISVITRAELYYGVAKLAQSSKLKNSVDNFIERITVLDWDSPASDIYAHIRANLEQQGRVIGAMDMQIAAHAISENLTLITNNTKEFERVAGLIIADWTLAK